ncbi:RiPP biosynthesis radical SAM protein ApyD [Rhizobium ruizarguesonis]|uniref:RiPP biosynthesis radical SAM protein ApyD n=1 Tax=Rhizobium ruizarguesonis TaxID=2081791 RepID=UPI001031EB88|nr:radical SAM protein [Rhizobium ruizarguesonis]TAY81978.1 B12-binding domain-containing radical SAM protein [Rhizobium ruizarguesonis]
MRLVFCDNFIMPAEDQISFLDLHPNLGLISLAGSLEEAGHEAVIYDPKYQIRFARYAYDSDFYAHAAADILRLGPNAVGFTTLGCSFLFAVNVAECIRAQEPELPILLGGPHATMLGKRILELYPQFDLVVHHEAERTLPEVLDNLGTRNFMHIPGVTWRERTRGEIRNTLGKPRIDDLDSLPLPLYEKYPIETLGLDLMRVEAGRGCPFECTFCSTATFFQRKYRLKSPARLLLEMDRLHEQYGTTEFKLDHDLFTVNRAKVLDFCEAVEGRHYHWRVSARTDCLDTELLERMANSGCIGLYVGIETGSERLQRTAKKRLKLQSVEPALDAAESLGIEVTASFITGFPDETREDHDETLDFVGRCFRRPQEVCIPQLHLLQPEPGTHLMTDYADQLIYDGRTTKFNARLLKDTDERLIAEAPEIFSTYYHYPSLLDRSLLAASVSAVDSLRSAGNEVFSYVLRFYEGRLSKLIAALREWVAINRPGSEPDVRAVVSFLATEMGKDHHLVSLFQYASTLRTMAFDRFIIDERCASAEAGKFRLNPRMRTFSNIHNCPDLLRLVRALPDGAPYLSEEQAGKLGHYMTVTEQSVERTFEIEPSVIHILKLFETPMDLREAASILKRVSGVATISEDLFSQLIDVRALLPLSSSPILRQTLA